MRRKQIIIAVGLAAMLVLAGCSSTGQEQEEQAEKIGQYTGDDISNVTVGGSYMYEIRMTEKNQMHLVQTQPPFQMEDSLERQNLIHRYKYLNDQNNVHHVYLMSNTGQVVSYFVAQGKVSSVNSKLTNDRQIVASQACLEETYNEDEAPCFKAVESPQMDGSYGTNGDAIFFFTTDGAYVEWNGKYVVSERPLNINSVEHGVVLTGEATAVNDSDE